MNPSNALADPRAVSTSDTVSTTNIGPEILKGLAADQKYIPSKYFYDERGSKLFEQICDLPEYYPTRTELGLLAAYAKDIVRGLRQGDLMELGAGGNLKVRTLLDAMGSRGRADVRYVPVDVCAPTLRESAAQLSIDYPELRVQGIVADFTGDLRLLNSARRKVVLFLGSTIGNLEDWEAFSLLQNVGAMLNPDDRFLIGLDMMKPVEILEAAYNDSRRVTAEFNKNILLVINRELAADFDPAGFDHLAFFNEQQRRVEMHLRAQEDTCVHLKDLQVSMIIRKGETIRTEICRKFRRDEAEHMIRDAGMAVSRWYTDPKGWFSIVEAVVAR